MTCDVSPIFMVGCSRSGTTWLRLILTGHSRICIPTETKFMIPLVGSLPLDRPLDEKDVLRAIDIIIGSEKWEDQMISDQELRANIMPLKSPRLGDIINAVYRILASREGKQRWGNKTPYDVAIIPELIAVFPMAKFINVVRDGRDVAISYKDAGFKNRWYHGDKSDWISAMRLREKYRSAPFSDRILDIYYEDLVRNVETNVRKICAFVEEDFEPAMLNWKGEIAPHIPERELRIHQALSRDPRLDDIARWKRSLTGIEIFLLESFLGNDLKKAGYERRFAAQKWVPALWLTKQAMRAARPLLDNSWRLRVGRVL